jgi:hypothetical protein
MSFQTKAFDTQDSLLDLLQDSQDLADWTIDYGLPSRRDELHIWIDEDIDDWSQSGDTSGLVSKDEAFSLKVYIYDRKTAANAKDIRDEIKAAAGYVADIIGSAPFLGGTVLYATIVSAQYEGAFQDSEGQVREGVLLLTIGCQAFISNA